MAKKVITTNRCPCCGYEHQVTEFYKDKAIKEKKLFQELLKERKLHLMRN